MSLVQADKVTFGYNGRTVIDGLSFSVTPGRIVCLLGPNGCGKTTLLDCILGSHKLQQGSVRLDGTNVAQLRPHEVARRIAYVPQKHERTFPYLVHEIVTMGRAAYTGMFSSPKQADRSLAEQALEQLGIAHLSKRPYTQLSGGEGQLVMLARALVQATPVIIMDEPTAHLDLHHELIILETIVTLVRSHAKSIIIATHNPNHTFYFEAAGVTTTVALLKQGRFLDQGTPQQTICPATMRELYGIDAGIVSYMHGKDQTIKQLIPVSAASHYGKS